jgi:hypothetical protein
MYAVQSIPGYHRDNNRNIVRIYKKDRFELFLDFLIATIIILKSICIIAFIVIQLVYGIAFLYSKIF